ncbi:MAG: protoporphyrinogen/coproporphyrinogen oxidase [Jatrophihabitans sp.]|uniref:protoporphyrinogen/coproporphyrinogen oxidase n=1 Tax=Jatrophihabitans sp. TaxID=1932789 RepID=UPI003F7E0FBB
MTSGVSVDVEFLVIGAGPTGLGAAGRLDELDRPYLVVEAADGPGGMAASFRDEHGFTWDMGGHVLHSHFEAFDKAIVGSGIAVRQVARNGWNWHRGELVPTPIQHQLDELPTDLRPDAPAAHLGDYYRNQFGAELAERFFIPFQEKMWAAPIELMAHDWTSLRNGSAHRNVPRPRLRSDAPPAGPVQLFPYPEGGTGRLWDALAGPLADQVRLATAVVAIDPRTRTATLSDGSTVRYQHVVSTLPLPQLAAMTGLDLPGVDTLLANSVYVVGLGFDGAPPATLADKTWLYCPDPELAWHRATLLSNYDPGNAGEGRWNVLFEVPRSTTHRPVSAQRALDDVRRSLEDLGVDLRKAYRPWTRSLSHGYPVATLGRDDVLRAADATLVAHGIRSRGRFGGWRYESCNQDYSFQQGRDAVDAALAGAPAGEGEDAYWHPERF